MGLIRAMLRRGLKAVVHLSFKRPLEERAKWNALVLHEVLYAVIPERRLSFAL